MPLIRSPRPMALVAPLLILALVACGGSSNAIATPAVSPTPTTSTDRAPATQSIATTIPTTDATPTSLANTTPSGTARSTEAGRATGVSTAVSTSVSTAVTPTPLARTTQVSGTTAVSSAASVGTTPRGTQAATSGSSVAGTGALPTTTPVPTTAPRGAAEQFLRATLAKGDISGYLTPALKSQAGTDGYKLLNIQPPVQEFTVDSEQRDADDNGATVRVTITTASGVAKRSFVMRKQGTDWLIDNVLS
jgi:hypothetical protein